MGAIENNLTIDQNINLFADKCLKTHIYVETRILTFHFFCGICILMETIKPSVYLVYANLLQVFSL